MVQKSKGTKPGPQKCLKKDGDADEGKSYKKKQLDREGKVREIVDSLKEHFF